MSTGPMLPPDPQVDARFLAMFDQIPVLAPADRIVRELPGGLTNRNFKITTPDGVYVARCTGTDALGIDRDQEHHNTRAAEIAGVGAPVIDYRPDLGLLVLGFLPGKPLTNADFCPDGMMPRVATACRRLHSGPPFRGTFDMFERQPAYLATALVGGFRIPPDYLEHVAEFEQMRRVLVAGDEGRVPCNNDLLAANFIDDSEKIWLIDYEYSGNNDPCFELGNVWSECGLTLEQLDELVISYYGRPRRSRIARARLQGIASKYGWTLWGCIQGATSPLDFDFWGWAIERYDSALAEFAGTAWSRLLTDAQLPD